MKLPRGETRTLQVRPGLSRKHTHVLALRMRCANDAECGAIAAGR